MRIFLVLFSLLWFGSANAQGLQAVVSTSPASGAAAWTQAISFRATSGAITDAEKQAYSLGGSDSGDYPITPICNGCSSAGDSTGVGWTNRSGMNGAVNNAGWSLVVRGSNYTGSGTTKTYSIAIPAGSYKFYVAFGQAAATPSAVTVTVKDGGSTLATITGASPGAGNVNAADNIAYTASGTGAGTWETDGATKFINITMSGTKLDVQISGASFNGIEWLKVTNQ